MIAGLVTLASLTALGPNPWEAYQDLKPGISLYMARYITNLASYDEADSAATPYSTE